MRFFPLLFSLLAILSLPLESQSLAADPPATVTLTQAELQAMIDQAVCKALDRRLGAATATTLPMPMPTTPIGYSETSAVLWAGDESYADGRQRFGGKLFGRLHGGHRGGKCGR